MATPKAPNYSAETVTALTGAYLAARKEGKENPVILADLATEFGKPVASIRSKLSSEKVYQKDERPTTASTRVKKADLVAAIAAKVEGGLSEAEAEGLEKSTAAPLAKILASLTNSPDSE